MFNFKQYLFLNDFYENLIFSMCDNQIFNESHNFGIDHSGKLILLTTNPKVEKGEKLGVKTYLLNLSPYAESGFNLCSHASKGCAMGCLHISGNAGTQSGKMFGRLRRTYNLYVNPDVFLDSLIHDIYVAKMQTKREGYSKLAIRLNGTSDLFWEDPCFYVDGKSIMDHFPDVMFYDYTKVPSRMNSYIKKSLPPNYHLTFSRSEKNEKDCDKVLENGGTVAIVFGPGKLGGNEKLILPIIYKGFEVEDGDESDARFMDAVEHGKGKVIGLRAKAAASWDFDHYHSDQLKNELFVIFQKNGINPDKVFNKSGFSIEAIKKMQEKSVLKDLCELLKKDSLKISTKKGSGFVVQPEDDSVANYDGNKQYVADGLAKKLYRIVYIHNYKTETYKEKRKEFFEKQSKEYEKFKKEIEIAKKEEEEKISNIRKEIEEVEKNKHLMSTEEYQRKMEECQRKSKEMEQLRARRDQMFKIASSKPEGNYFINTGVGIHPSVPRSFRELPMVK